MSVLHNLPCWVTFGHTSCFCVLFDAFGCFQGLPVYFRLWTQVLLYIKLLQSGFKCARVWSTEVPVMVGKDFFKYSLSPGSGVTKPWYFKGKHSAPSKADKHTKQVLLFVCHACGWKHFYQCYGRQSKHNLKGLGMHFRKHFEDAAASSEVFHSTWSCTSPSNSVPWKVHPGPPGSLGLYCLLMRNFSWIQKGMLVCFSYITYTLIPLKLPGSCCAGLCICSTDEFFPQGIS